MGSEMCIRDSHMTRRGMHRRLLVQQKPGTPSPTSSSSLWPTTASPQAGPAGHLTSFSTKRKISSRTIMSGICPKNKHIWEFQVLFVAIVARNCSASEKWNSIRHWELCHHFLSTQTFLHLHVRQAYYTSTAAHQGSRGAFSDAIKT